MKIIPYLLLIFTLASRVGFSATEQPIDPAHDSAPVRVACVGASITQGVGAAPGKSYPAQLQSILGPRWLVKNFGVSGRTLMKKGDRSYWAERAFKSAQDFHPDVVIILLGGNDTKPQNWVHHDEFLADYQAFVETFKNLPSHPRVFICRPTPVIGKGNYGINEPHLLQELPLIDQVASAENVTIIDLHAALLHKPELFPDRVHPNTAGAALIAQIVATALTGKPATP